VSPDTTTEVAEPDADALNPPGDEVTVYEAIGLPPFETGAVQVTVALALPAVAVPMVGAVGVVGAALFSVKLAKVTPSHTTFTLKAPAEPLAVSGGAVASPWESVVTVAEARPAKVPLAPVVRLATALNVTGSSSIGPEPFLIVPLR
jgi:hypothetical protein